MFRPFSVLLLVLIVAGCSKSLPELENVDLKAWKNDKNACGAYRSNNIEAIKTQKEKLLGLDESKIIELLGRPDRNELYKRNQKFFYYYLQAGPGCSNAAENTSRLAIRFNAMGLAKEVAIE
jgi:outer membrane protein assembly factor BamE (lipoprotein component of BamABCDE complex)